MKFITTPIDGVLVLERSPHVDERGSFQRLWCEHEAASNNLPAPVVQTSLSETRRKHTLRGMHYQSPPSREAKVIHCLRGRVFDVALDLRPKSPTFLDHFGIELSASGSTSLLIPAGCAHGFLTLTDDCAILYMMTDYYRPDLSQGVRWNDDAFGITWPAPPREMLERDADYPDFDPANVNGFSDY